MKKAARITIASMFVLSVVFGASVGVAIAADESDDDPATCDAEGQGDGGTDEAEDRGADDRVDEADNNCRDTPEGEAGNSDQ